MSVVRIERMAGGGSRWRISVDGKPVVTMTSDSSAVMVSLVDTLDTVAAVARALGAEVQR